jgi:hypothetical protein
MAHPGANELWADKTRLRRLNRCFRLAIRYRHLGLNSYRGLSLSAIPTSSGNDLARIFMIWLRYILTVASLAPSSAATC